MDSGYVNFLKVGDIVFPGMEVKGEETIIHPMTIFNSNNRFFTKVIEVNPSYHKPPKGVKYFGWFSDRITPRGLSVFITDYKEEEHTVFRIVNKTVHVTRSNVAIRITQVLKKSCLGEIVEFKLQ